MMIKVINLLLDFALFIYCLLNIISGEGSVDDYITFGGLLLLPILDCLRIIYNSKERE